MALTLYVFESESNWFAVQRLDLTDLQWLDDTKKTFSTLGDVLVSIK